MLIADDEPTEAGGFPSGILGDAPKTEGAHGSAPPATNGLAENNPLAEPPPADDNPLMRAFTAQQRAEELQRDAPQRPPPSSAIEQHIQKIPNLSEHKRAFLRQFPVLLSDPITQQIFNRHYQAGLQSGLGDDSPELDNYLIANTAREIEQRRQQLEPAHEPARTIEEEVRRLDDEVESGMRSEQPPKPIAPPPARRRVPMSAPVSRDTHDYSGRPQSANTSMTLSAEERDIAHRSYTAHNMTDAQKEYEYAKQKRRMIAAKANGEIQG